MRATEPGAIVGIALEAYSDSGEGTVLAFVNVGEKNISKGIQRLLREVELLKKRWASVSEYGRRDFGEKNTAHHFRTLGNRRIFLFLAAAAIAETERHCRRGIYFFSPGRPTTSASDFRNPRSTTSSP